MAEKKRRVRIMLDAKTVYAFEALIRDGFVAAGAASEADNQNIALSPKSIRVAIDGKTAAKISELLRDGLVASGAVSEADNENSRLTP